MEHFLLDSLTVKAARFIFASLQRDNSVLYRNRRKQPKRPQRESII